MQRSLSAWGAARGRAAGLLRTLPVCLARQPLWSSLTAGAGLSTAPGPAGRGVQQQAPLVLRVDALPVVYHPLYSAPKLPPRHRFPMGVFRRIHDTLLEEHVVQPEQVFTPPSLPSREVLELVHDPEYVQSFLAGTLDEQRLRRIGFGEAARSQTLIDRTLAEVAGTLMTAQLALAYGIACNTAGGTHHAFPAAGSGFCILNDLAITTEELLRRRAVDRVLILDLDVHQGDGTAAAFAGRDDVFTLSIHAERNFPARKQCSTHDIGLPDGTGDDEYLRCVSEVLPGVLQTFRPDLVLYDAGVDPHVEDELGRLALTDEGLWRREMLVLDTCLAFGVPIAGYVGGGYYQDLDWLARRHCFLHKAASELWEARRL